MRAGMLASAFLALTFAGWTDTSKTGTGGGHVAAAIPEATRGRGDSTPADGRAGGTGTPAHAELVAPEPLAPADGTEFSQFPRKTTVKWAPVPGAAKYKVEVEYQTPDNGEWHPAVSAKETNATEYQFDFSGAQPGRWRVWAVDATGKEGPRTDWKTVRYTK